MQGWEEGGILRLAHKIAVKRLTRYGQNVDDCPTQYELLYMSEVRRLKKIETRQYVTRKMKGG